MRVRLGVLAILLAAAAAAARSTATSAECEYDYGRSIRKRYSVRRLPALPDVQHEQVDTPDADDVVAIPAAPAAEQTPGRQTMPIRHAWPPWQFEKADTLPSFLGGTDLPYTGYRGCAPFACASLLYADGQKLSRSRLGELAGLDPEKDGTPQAMVVSYLARMFDVIERRQATPSELVEHLDRGSPVWVVIRSGRSLHSALVTGYQTGRSGKVLSWHLTDNGVVQGLVPHDRFLRMWKASDSFDNYVLLVHRKPGQAPSVFQKEVQLPAITLPQDILSHHNDAFLLAGIFRSCGCSIDQAVVDQIVCDIDPEGDGISTTQCAAYLEQFFDVSLQQQTRFSDLSARLDAGLPALLILNTRYWTHWTLLAGYRTNQYGLHESWTILDIAGKHELPHRAFLDAWDNECAENFSLFITPNPAKPKPTFSVAPDLSAVVRLPVKEHHPFSAGEGSGGTLAVASFLTALGKNIDEAHLAGLAQLIDPQKDRTGAEEIVAYLSKYFDVHEHRNLQLGQLKNELDAGRPVALATTAKSGRHQWSVLTGYRADRSGDFVSWDLVQNGKILALVPHEEFVASAGYQGPVICIGPKSESDLKWALLTVGLDCILATLPCEETMTQTKPAGSASLANNRAPRSGESEHKTDNPVRSKTDADLSRQNAQGEQKNAIQIGLSKVAKIPLRYVFMLLGLSGVALAAAYFTQPKLDRF